MILVSKRLTGPENYAPWQRSMKIALSAKNKLVIVNGLYEAPDRNSPLFSTWERVNDMIISWLLNCMTDELSNTMTFVSTAAAVWKELEERFSGIDGHRVFQIQKDLNSLTQGNSSIEIFHHK